MRGNLMQCTDERIFCRCALVYDEEDDDDDEEDDDDDDDSKLWVSANE